MAKHRDQQEVEASVLSALAVLNEVLQELADDGWIVTLNAAGHLYEARIVTDEGIVVLRLEDHRPKET